MDQKTKETRYLEKIENDVDEKVYDLLIQHLQGVTDKVTADRERLIALLDKAIVDIKAAISSYNRLSFYRYLIILCNTVLRFKKDRQDLKELKMDVIEEFTHCEPETGEKIPLHYQINEIRLTYRTEYLVYLVNRFIEMRLWGKALYCLIAIRLVEPDLEGIDEQYETIRQNMSSRHIEEPLSEVPENKILALDSNVVISKILFDVGNYRIKSVETFDLVRLGNKNRFIVAESVAKEVKFHMDYELSKAWSFCKANPGFDYKLISSTLQKRYDRFIGKYKCEPVKVSASRIKDVNDMYALYLAKLEELLMDKLKGQSLSHKLRKLAQREVMLPEFGDRKLLAEVAQLRDSFYAEKGLDIGILTLDRDFIAFSVPIFERFGVRIYGGPAA